MEPGTRRFYKIAAVESGGNGHFITLDGRRVRTPAGAPLFLPARALARAVATEWNTQEETIVSERMPLMSLSATAIDWVIPNFGDVAAAMAGYAGSDLLCYRAGSPPELAVRQAEGWDPILNWASVRYDARFEVTAGIMPVDQPEETCARFRTVAAGMDPFTLTAAHVLTMVLGSFLLALAVLERVRAPTDAFALSRLDETYQEEFWGIDEEATARRDRLSAEVANAQRFLDLLGA